MTSVGFWMHKASRLKWWTVCTPPPHPSTLLLRASIEQTHSAVSTSPALFHTAGTSPLQARSCHLTNTVPVTTSSSPLCILNPRRKQRLIPANQSFIHVCCVLRQEKTNSVPSTDLKEPIQSWNEAYSSCKAKTSQDSGPVLLNLRTLPNVWVALQNRGTYPNTQVMLKLNRSMCCINYMRFNPHSSVSPHASAHQDGYIGHDPQTSGSPTGPPSSHMARHMSSSQVRCHGDNSWISTQSMNGYDTCLSLRFWSCRQNTSRIFSYPLRIHI